MTTILRACLLLLSLASTVSAQVTISQTAWSANANAFETDAVETVSFASQVSVGCRVYTGILLSATNRTISSVTDDGSNSYALSTQGGTNATTEVAAAATEVWIYEAAVTTAMQTVTVTISSALATPARVALLAVCGQHATTPTEDVAIATQTSATSHPCGGLVTAAAGSALFGIMAGSNGTYSTPAGWTQIGSTVNFIADQRTIGAATTTWTPTTAASEGTASACVAIAPAAASSASCFMTVLGTGVCG